MRFSVGRIKLGTDVIGLCSGISVRVEGNLVDYYGGGFFDPREIEVGNRTITITIDTIEWVSGIDPKNALSNEYLDVELMASAQDPSRGIAGITLTNCKASSWEITSTQDGFVSYRVELRYARHS